MHTTAHATRMSRLNDVKSAPLGLYDLLELRGFAAFDQAKMVRHEDQRYPMSVLREQGQLDFYQGYQRKRVYSRPYVVSFLGRPNQRAVFYGVYRVLACRDPGSFAMPSGLRYPEFHKPGHHWYDLEELSGFEEYRDRVIIDWGDGARQWCQYLRNCEVLEILPKNYARNWPGYLQVILSYAQLQQMVGDPAAYREWHRALSTTAGVYMILDRKTGRHYVGSATGKGGLLQRWSGYVKDPSGGNVLLKAALGDESLTSDDLQFTILHTLSPTMTVDEMMQVESLYKLKLGTRRGGLNAN